MVSFFYCAGASAGKNKYKNNSQREQRFRLHGCPEDDTIFLLKMLYIFGCARRSGAPTLGRLFFYNVKDLAFLRGLSINTARQMTGSIVLYTAG